MVRQTVPLNLQPGLNHVSVSDITFHLEPDSVVLRDPAEKRILKIREQNYRADPISQDLLLSLNEGKTIDFQVTHGDQISLVQGKIVRSGYVPHTEAYSTFGQQYQYQQQSYGGASGQPIIEVGGKLQFALPGLPLFPSLPDDSVLKPTLDWQLITDKGGPVNAELAYVTGGMTWKAAYNVVFPEVGDALDLSAWVTMDNESGKTFENARIKLMAGDVSKLQNGQQGYEKIFALQNNNSFAADAVGPAVTEKAFDEYHLYTLANPATLRDREIKQVEFARAAHVPSTVIYVYDGFQPDDRYSNYNYDNLRNVTDYGTQSNRKVFTMREFVNSMANGLGIPLPKGRMRFYRRDTDGQLEFVGENDIDHTPKDETVRVYTGNAFDLTGDRKQTNYNVDGSGRTIDESFTLTLHNHKTTPTEIRVVEHLYRGATWTITAKTNTFLKTDAHTIEFRVTLPPDTDKTLSYTAHYTW